MKAVVDVVPEVALHSGLGVCSHDRGQSLIHQADSCAIIADDSRLPMLEGSYRSLYCCLNSA